MQPNRIANGILAIMLVGLAGACSDAPPAKPPADRTDRPVTVREFSDQDNLKVLATIYPLADVTQAIAGPHAEVLCLLPPGQTPHGYSPTPDQAAAARRAQLVVRVGMGVDAWAEPIVSTVHRQGGAVLTALDAPQQDHPDPTDDHDDHDHAHEGHDDHDGHDHVHDDHDGHDHAHSAGDGDPHVWLDPVWMEHFVARVTDALAAADPANAQAYRQRGQDYAARVRQLHQSYQQTLEPLAGAAFVTEHAAFGRVANRYGLKQFALHNVEGTGFGPDRLQQIRRFMREHNCRALYTEPQYSAEKLRTIAGPDVYVGQLDPLGSPAVTGYDSYLAMMQSNLEQLRKGLTPR